MIVKTDFDDLKVGDFFYNKFGFLLMKIEAAPDEWGSVWTAVQLSDGNRWKGAGKVLPVDLKVNDNMPRYRSVASGEAFTWQSKPWIKCGGNTAVNLVDGVSRTFDPGEAITRSEAYVD